jgi:hypothetical protein
MMVIDMMVKNTVVAVVVVVVVAKGKMKFRFKLNNRYLHLDVF